MNPMKNKYPTILVAGCARSGLTMTMQMLDAGGFPCLGEYPDYEPYNFGGLPWEHARGKALKIPDAHEQLQISSPPFDDYLVITPRRDLRQQAESSGKLMRQIPILKVAILDRHFFEHKKHPARQLLDSISRSALGWSNDHYKEQRLIDKIEQVVDFLLNEFEQDIGVFQTALDDFLAFVEDESIRSPFCRSDLAQG